MIGSEEYTRDFIPRILNMYSFKSEVTVLLWMRGRKLSWCSSKNSTSYSLRVYWVRAVAIFILIGRKCVRTEGQNQIKVFDLPTSWFTFAEHIPNLPIYNHQINEQRHRKKLTWSQWSPVYICIYVHTYLSVSVHYIFRLNVFISVCILVSISFSFNICPVTFCWTESSLKFSPSISQSLFSSPLRVSILSLR